MANTVITVTIPEANWPAVRNGFVTQRPIPKNPDGTNLMTPRKWVAECLADYVERIARAGHKAIAEQAVNVDVTVVRDTTE